MPLIAAAIAVAVVTFILTTCSLAVLLCFGLLIAFFLSEKWWWHNNPSIEQRLLGLWSALFTSIVLFYDDTLIAFLRPFRHWTIDLILVGGSYFSTRMLVHNFEQSRIRGHSVGRSFRDVYTALFTGKKGSQWRPRKEAKQILNQTLDYIDSLKSSVPDFQRPLRQNRLRDMEGQIIDGLSILSNEELSDIITHINIGALLYNVRNRIYTFSSATNNKSRLLKLLCVDRLAALDAPARAAVLNGMQASGLFQSMTKEATENATFLLLRTYGDDLLLVRNMLDSSGNYHNLHKLIFVDFPDDEHRKSVLAHIEREAKQFRQETSSTKHGNAIKSVRTLGNLAELRSTNLMSDDERESDEEKETAPIISHDLLPQLEAARRKRERDRAKPAKILSDIDDTLLASGGDNIAGVDGRLPAKCCYPGVTAFYKQLDLGPTADDNVWPDGRVGNLVFLSARPHIYKDATESASFALFERLKSSRGLHCTPALLSGSLSSIRGMRASYGYNNSPKGVYLADYAQIGDKKYKNLSEYRSLYPEYKLLYVGDNGQADLDVAYRASQAGLLWAAFIHQVKPVEMTFGYTPGNAERWKQSRIILFRTYIDAALAAQELGLISLEGLRHVITQTVQDVHNLLAEARTLGPSWWLSANKSAWIELFNEDLFRANEFMHISIDPIVLTPEDLIEPKGFAGKAMDISRRLSQSITIGRMSKRTSTSSVESSSPLPSAATAMRLGSDNSEKSLHMVSEETDTDPPATPPNLIRPPSASLYSEDGTTKRTSLVQSMGITVPEGNHVTQSPAVVRAALRRPNGIERSYTQPGFSDDSLPGTPIGASPIGTREYLTEPLSSSSGLFFCPTTTDADAENEMDEYQEGGFIRTYHKPGSNITKPHLASGKTK